MPLHYTQGFILMPGKISQYQTGHKEQRSQNRGSTAQKIGRSRRTEQAAGSAAAERSAHIRTFALLEQHKDNHGHRKQQMQNQNERFQILIL